MSCVEKTTVVPVAPQLEDRVAQRLGVDRIEPGERLVENQQPRLARRSAAMNWTFCAMPFDSWSIRLSAQSSSCSRSSQCVDHRIELGLTFGP